MLITKNVLSNNNRRFAYYKSLNKIKTEGGYVVNPEDLGDGSHQKVIITCDSQKSEKCLNIVEREWRQVSKQRDRTNGKDYCMFCQKTEEFSGRNNPNSKYIFDDSFFCNIDSPEKAYLLGWIASDGTIAKSSITIAIRDYDVSTLIDLRNIICNELPIRDKSNLKSLTISSTEIVKDVLRHLGLKTYGKKDTAIQFPTIKKELEVYFIRGFFDGDGSVNKHDRRPRVSISSNSVSILNSLKSIIGCGNVYTSNNQSVWEVNQAKKALEFLAWLYEDKNVPYLRRKYEIYLDLSSWVPSLSGADSYRNFNLGPGVIKINKSRKDAILPKISDIHASGIDLHLIDKVKDFGPNTVLYTTGLKVQPPMGYYFDLVPRSSISKTSFMLANSVGIIDENYIGEVMVALYNYGKDEIDFPSRLVQLVLRKKYAFEVVEVEDLEETARGELGFGSTGV